MITPDYMLQRLEIPSSFYSELSEYITENWDRHSQSVTLSIFKIKKMLSITLDITEKDAHHYLYAVQSVLTYAGWKVNLDFDSMILRKRILKKRT